jgi:hypothetical protein
MIKKENEFSVKALAELVLSRQGTGRGGEHAFLCWNEGTWDPLFQAIDFGWAIIKQLDCQCMLFFCDSRHYKLCPYFALACYFMMGGLRRNCISKVTSPFVFPYLHNMARNSVAKRMTTNIRAHIPNADDKKGFLSRSLRCGAMTENAANKHLTKELQYARSGHTSSEMNSNAEGYIAQSSALSMPAGLNLAGCDNCYATPQAFSFGFLGESAFPSATRLVSELFTNNVPQLQEAGKLRPLIMTAAACLVGHYIKLVNNVSGSNQIVSLTQSAAQRAAINDETVPEKDGIFTRWHVVLQEWSKKILDDFHSCNPLEAANNSSLSDQVVASLVQALSRRVELLDAQIQNRHEDRTAVELARDSSAIQASQAHQLKINNEMLKCENHRLKSALASLASQSPAKGTAEDLRSPLPTEAAGRNLAAEFNQPLSGSVHQRDDSFDNVEEPLAPVAKKCAFAAMDGVQTLHTEKIGGITVENELERLWKDKILSNLHNNASVDEPVSKSVL